MISYVLAALLLGGSASPWHDGSVLVLENSNKAVTLHTDSSVTHVAVLFHHGSTPWVYEATPARVRRLPLSGYCRELGELNGRRNPQARLWILKPEQPYSQPQRERMRGFAESQLGRRYSVKSYLRGEPADGIHCAQFTASTLLYSGRYEMFDHCAISPSKLVRQMRPFHDDPVCLPVRPIVRDESLCAEWWDDWRSWQSWCRWAWWESWTVMW